MDAYIFEEIFKCVCVYVCISCIYMKISCLAYSCRHIDVNRLFLSQYHLFSSFSSSWEWWSSISRYKLCFWIIHVRWISRALFGNVLDFIELFLIIHEYTHVCVCVYTVCMHNLYGIVCEYGMSRKPFLLLSLWWYIIKI